MVVFIWAQVGGIARFGLQSPDKARTLIRQRILIPLKMPDTDFELSEKLKSNLAPGHDNALQPAPAVSATPIYSIMPAGGGLYSTANDLLTFLSECMGYEPSPLASLS